MAQTNEKLRKHNQVFFSPQTQRSCKSIFYRSEVSSPKVNQLDGFLSDLDDLQDTIFDVWDQVTTLNSSKIEALSEIEKNTETRRLNFLKHNEAYLQGKKQIERKRLAKQQDAVIKLIESNKRRSGLVTHISEEQLRDPSQLMQLLDHFAPAKTKSPTISLRRKKTAADKDRHPTLEQLKHMRMDQVLSFSKRGFGAPFITSEPVSPDLPQDRDIATAYLTDKYRDTTELEMLKDCEEIKKQQLEMILETMPKPVDLTKYTKHKLIFREKPNVNAEALNPKNKFIYNQLKKFRFGQTNDLIKKTNAQKAEKMQQIQPTRRVKKRAQQLVDEREKRKKWLDMIKLDIQKTQKNRRIDNIRREGLAAISSRCARNRLLSSDADNESDSYLLKEIIKENSNQSNRFLAESAVRQKFGTGSKANNKRQSFLEAQLKKAEG